MAVDKLGDDDIFSLVTYDNETDLLIPPERVGGTDHREDLKARIHRIQPGGSTALHAGVVLGAKQVRRHFEKERVNRVILLSDGIANVGPELFGSEKRRYLVRCLAEGKTDAVEAAAELSYATISGGQAPSQRQAAKITFTDDEKKADASVRAEVARENSVVQNRVAKETAVKLADEGKSKDAVALLRQQAAKNAAAPAEAQLPGVAEENRRLEAAATEIDSQGRLEKSRRKSMQFENYADKYQKSR